MIREKLHVLEKCTLKLLTDAGLGEDANLAIHLPITSPGVTTILHSQQIRHLAVDIHAHFLISPEHSGFSNINGSLETLKRVAVIDRGFDKKSVPCRTAKCTVYEDGTYAVQGKTENQQDRDLRDSIDMMRRLKYGSKFDKGAEVMEGFLISHHHHHDEESGNLVYGKWSHEGDKDPSKECYMWKGEREIGKLLPFLLQ